jgi:hypothetical protein
VPASLAVFAGMSRPDIGFHDIRSNYGKEPQRAEVTIRGALRRQPVEETAAKD